MINECPHVVNTTKTKMQHMCWEALEHPATLAGTQRMPIPVGCSSETSCSQLFPAAASEFFKKGIQHLVTKWDTRLNVGSEFESVQ
jgi:hypothetical protein